MKLTRLVQEWYWDELENAPLRDPRRTPECLSFETLEAAARVPEAAPAAQLAHIVSCDWCRRSWITFQNLEQQRSEQVTSPVLALEGIRSMPLLSDVWTPEYTVMVSQYLNSASYLAVENREITPAHFDHEGTLRVHWSGLEHEGPVAVSLLIEGHPRFLTSGIVNHGLLEIVEPLAHLGQRNVELPVSVLHLQPVAEPHA